MTGLRSQPPPIAGIQTRWCRVNFGMSVPFPDIAYRPTTLGHTGFDGSNMPRSAAIEQRSGSAIARHRLRTVHDLDVGPPQASQENSPSFAILRLDLTMPKHSLKGSGLDQD